MDSVTASLVQSPAFLRRTSENIPGSIFLTASCPGFMRFASGPQFRLRQHSSFLKSRRIFVVKASASGDASTDSIAPLQLKSPVGQFLSQILVSHPHLVPAAVEQQLEQLQTDRDAEEQNKDASSVPGTDIVLYSEAAEHVY